MCVCVCVGLGGEVGKRRAEGKSIHVSLDRRVVALLGIRELGTYQFRQLFDALSRVLAWHSFYLGTSRQTWDGDP